MESIECSICSQPVSRLEAIKFDCGHFVHGECDPNADDICSACVEREKITETNKQKIAEAAVPLKGQERIVRPVDPGFLGRIWRGVREVKDQLTYRNVDAVKSGSVWVMLKEGLSIEEMMNAGVTIDKLRQEQVTLEKLFAYGYELGHLRWYPEIARKETALHTLHGLGMTPALLVQYKSAIPIDELRATCGYSWDYLVKRIGFRIDETLLDDEWTMEDLIYLGAKTPKDLFKAGLKHKSTFQLLEPTSVDLNAIGWKPVHTNMLEDDLKDSDSEDEGGGSATRRSRRKGTPTRAKKKELTIEQEDEEIRRYLAQKKKVRPSTSRNARYTPVPIDPYGDSLSSTESTSSSEEEHPPPRIRVRHKPGPVVPDPPTASEEEMRLEMRRIARKRLGL